MRTYGRSGASIAWLRAFSQPIPNVWLLQEQAESDVANNQVSLVLEQQLQAEGDYEAEDMSFAECAPPPIHTPAHTSLRPSLPLRTESSRR